MSLSRTTAMTAALTALAAVSTATAGHAREQVQVAGSSTVLPYATIVAEAFGENTEYPTPVIESGGSSAGLKRFCEGVGENTIDIANASRPMREGEVEACVAAGVDDIIEVRIGYDGIVFASQQAGPAFTEFTPAHWYEALAAEIPGEDGTMAANAKSSWTEVDESLPDAEILAFIPGTKHGTREVFEEKVLLQGCEDTGAMERMTSAGMDDDAAEEACMAVRTDGASVDIDGDYTETLSRIDSNPAGVGVFGLAFYENNQDKLKVATMNGGRAVDGDDRVGRVSGLPPALLLRQGRAYRRDPGPQGVRAVLHGRGGRRAGRAARRVRARLGPRAGGRAADHRGRGQHGGRGVLSPADPIRGGAGGRPRATR